MTKDEFIVALAGVLESPPSQIGLETELSVFKLWDSTAVINLVVALDDNGVKVEEEKIRDCRTVQDLIDLAKGAIH